GTYRISAETELEGIVQRVMAAPFDGYIAESTVRAGDIVKAGDVVARLEDEELRLERQRHLSERSQYRHEYNDAYANNERSSVNIGRARMNQASAALALTEQKLARSNIVAPFDGVVIDGDLSQRLGGFVEQGEVLFEIAPLDNYRVILFVEDTRIADVSTGQQGTLVLSSMPEQSFRFEVETITPITEAREGANYFRVEARLADGAAALRPGMEGIGKIDVDDRLLIAIWTRGFVDWLRLQIWKWVP
ncbi:MAG: HlyD family efflux transporter periplasmic adaptor subunit, partial [Pseudomonadota bacterium]